MVARRWGWDRVPPRWEPGEQDAGDHQGPPNRSSTTLAPTAHPASRLTSRLSLMDIGGPLWSPVLAVSNDQLLTNNNRRS